MTTHLGSPLTALPPPSEEGGSGLRRSRRYLTTRLVAVAGTLMVIGLAIVSALTLIAITPESIAVPATLLLIGGLTAGSLVIRDRLALTRRAYARVPRSRSAGAYADSLDDSRMISKLLTKRSQAA